MGSSLRCSAIAIVGVGVLLVGCKHKTDPTLAQPNIVRDSAGVEIVENFGPLWAKGEEWWTDSLPAVTIAEPEEGDTRFALSRVTSVARLSDGRYLVVSKKVRQVQLFDRSGEFVRLIGRVGEGPGEFLMPDHVLVRGDSIVVASGGAYFGPLNIFDSLGNVLKTERSTSEFLSSTLGPGNYWENRDFLSDGSYIAHVSHGDSVYRMAVEGELVRPPMGFYRVSRDGRVDSLGWYTGIVQRKVSPQSSVPFSGLLPFWVASYATGGGEPMQIFAASAESRDIDTYDEHGKLIRIVRRMTLPAPISDSAWNFTRTMALKGRKTAQDSAATLAAFSEKSRQTTYPTVSNMLVDAEGELWVMQHDGYQVYDRSGRWLGNPKHPGAQLLFVGTDYMTFLRRDADGMESVVEYRLHRERRP